MTDRRPNPADPTSERTAEGSTQSASGLSGDRPGPEEARRNDDKDDLAPRGSEDARSTPPRPQDPDRDHDPVMPTDDSSLGTKI